VNKDKKRVVRDIVPFFLMAGIFVLTQSLALLVAAPFEEAGVTVFENPSDPTNLVFFFLSMLGFTAVILLISRFWRKRLVQVIVLGSLGLLYFYAVYPLLAFVFTDPWVLGISVAVTVFLIALLVRYPEWYVLDFCGILAGAGAIAMLGISLSVFLVFVLLVGLAVYDAVSVYQTKHMIDLADTVLDLRLPIILVIPKRRRYSLLEETKSLKEKLKAGEKREAFFVGLGDIVMPGILVVSTFANIGSNGLLIALSVMVGTLFGFAVLVAFVVKGRPQAGLPFLCSGAILGYVVSSYLLFGGLVGLTLPV